MIKILGNDMIFIKQTNRGDIKIYHHPEFGRIAICSRENQLGFELCVNYAKENDKILDTHGGSLSIALAVDNMNKINGMNLTLDVCELDKDYYDTGVKRVQNHVRQLKIGF